MGPSLMKHDASVTRKLQRFEQLLLSPQTAEKLRAVCTLIKSVWACARWCLTWALGNKPCVVWGPPSVCSYPCSIYLAVGAVGPARARRWLQPHRSHISQSWSNVKWLRVYVYPHSRGERSRGRNGFLPLGIKASTGGASKLISSCYNLPRLYCL
jgi:hypothetical protein